MAGAVEYAGSDKAKVFNISTSEVPASENLEPSAPSPTSTTMSQPGFRTPDHDEEAQPIPPVWGQHRVVREVEPDVKTINIHIQINVPSTFKLPSFRRSNCQWKKGQKCDVKKLRPRFLASFLGLLYLSFIACAGAAWGLQDRYWLNGVCHPPLIIATFTPFFDAFATVSTILMIRRYKDSDRPKFRYALVLLMHVVLTILHLVVLGFGAAWANSHAYWYYRHQKRAIAGLVLYCMSTMLLIKLILFLFVLKNGGLRRNIKASVTQFPSMVKKEVEYERLTADCDEDASHIESARPSTEGRIFLS